MDNSPSEPGIRHRKSNYKKELESDHELAADGYGSEIDNKRHSRGVTLDSRERGHPWEYRFGIVIVTLLAVVTRFWRLSFPREVVFDEVHFGKFASLYLQRLYFFDVHPPFGKLLFAFAGWVVGYDGAFMFDNIGDSYLKNNVPYIAYRTIPAILGSLTVPVVFSIMWESGYSLPASLVAASLMIFDNAHVAQTRLILLDATLVFFMSLSVLNYVRFYKMRHDPFSFRWWRSLILTGVSLSCVMSTKYVGACTFFSIGVPVMIDLWSLLSARRRQGCLPISKWLKHFAARAAGLIVLPFLIYLFWFYVHFEVLNKSGPGDDFMTPEFQQTLSDNAITRLSMPIEYGDSITIKHTNTKVYLHSHPQRYPLLYEDGRVSSQGQQVTGYPFNDTNNWWQILPPALTNLDDLQELRKNHTQIQNNAVVRLRHLGTDSYLLTHDVASPFYPTNQEFTTVTYADAFGKRANETLFEIKIEKSKQKTGFSTMSSHFRLVHFPTRVALWTQSKTPLPDWGFKQAEINGNKNALEASNLWFSEAIPSLQEDDPRSNKKPRTPTKMPFYKKYLELQRAIFYHNNALTSSHPYASHPIQWPFLLRGVSFWTNNSNRQQIYFMGNPIGWWMSSTILAVFVGVILADQVALQRGIDGFDARARRRLYDSTGFFLLTWLSHYAPFWLMGRQLFLHHYLPAHLASTLAVGALVDFVFEVDRMADRQGRIKFTGKSDGNNISQPADAITKRNTCVLAIRERRSSFTGTCTWTWLVSIALISVLVWSFLYFSSFTYGYPMTIPQVISRKWLGLYDYHFSK